MLEEKVPVMGEVLEIEVGLADGGKAEGWIFEV